MGYKKKKASAKKAKAPKLEAAAPPVMTPPSFEQEALAFKEAGNEHVQKTEYLQALEAYGKGLACFEQQQSIQLQPHQVELQNLLYSNRAFILLKLGHFDDAEKECSAALLQQGGGASLSKVWYRRALAREGRARKLVSKSKQTESCEEETKSTESSSDAMTITTQQVMVTETDNEESGGPDSKLPNAGSTTETTQLQIMKREKQLRYQLATEILLLAQEDLLTCIQLLERQTPDSGMKRSVDQLMRRLQKMILEYRQRGATSLQNPSEQRSTVLLLLSNRRACIAAEDSKAIALEGEAFFLLDWDWWYKWCLYVGLVPETTSSTEATTTASQQLLSLLPGACALEPREEDSDDDDDDDSEDYEPLPPGPIDNTRLILEFPEKIDPNISTRDAFFADWYRPYKDHISTMDTNENDKENVNGDKVVSSHGSLSPVLRPNMVRGYHFEAIPREVYSALRTWYGELSPTVCRRVVKTPTGDLILPLYFTPGNLEKRKMAEEPSAEEPFLCSACGALRAKSRCQQCLVARYCNRSCQQSHWYYHKHECKKQSGDDSPAITWYDGTCRVGLNNLGNTCFMNSALQALSHTVPLTRHFLSGAYKSDLNPDNPLGTGGKLADAYAAVLKDMWWNGNRKTSTSPSALKRAIALFAPRFAGCIQHDSQEFLAYFLDGLHEDLNRIRKAPYVEMPDVTDGQNMNVAAFRAWEAHCRRNDSLVMDTFYGQFKSTCVCPKCNRVSLSFDAFNHVSLEIPQAKSAIIPICVWVFPAGRAKTPVRYTVEIRRNKTIFELRTTLAGLSGIPAEMLVVCEVLEHVIVDKPKLSNPVSDIRSDDFMVAYELEHFCTVFHLVVSHNRVEVSDMDIQDNEVKMEPLGFPFMTTCPNDWTCKEIWDYLWTKVAHFVSHEDETDGEQKHLLKIRLHDGRGKSLCIFSSGNDQFSPYLPSDSDESLVDVLGQLAVEPYIFLSLDWSEASPGQISVDQFNLFTDHPSWIEASQRKLKSPKAGMTLDQCFDAFTTPERLDENNKWYCSNCKEHVQAMKTMELWRLPNVLIVHLKRFEFKNILRRDKLDTLVDFPLASLDMSRHCASRSENDGFTHDQVPAIYDLFAVTNHYGRMGAGHYTAFARSWNERTGISEDWSLFDDANVRPVQNANATDAIVTPAAYVLFYRRRIFH